MSTTTDPPTDTDPDREAILSILAANVRALDEAIDSEPAEDPTDERLRLQQLRTLGSLAGEYRRLQKDRDLDEMAEEIDFLKTETGADGAPEGPQ